MNIRIQPTLDGAAGERFSVFAARLSDPHISDTDVHKLVGREAAWAQRSPVLNGQTHAYEAAARLLADLRVLKWTIRADGYGIELESPPHPRLQARSPEVIRAAKDAVRDELAPAIAQQFADPLVRKFIRDLESPSRGTRRSSIRALIADGAELHARLRPALAASPAGRAAALGIAIQPYLQLIPGEGDATVLDEFTGIPLGDVWRYFRYTWSIPQTAIPGRQMFYLVRDRAHPCHAVIGIAALGNTPLVSLLRDNAIGWTQGAFAARLLAAVQARDRGQLRRLVRYLETLINGAIDEIDPKELVKPGELAAPSDDVIARLQRRASEFASRRADALREVAEAASAGVPIAVQETEQLDYRLPPVSTAMLELEGKRAPKDKPETLARQLLVAKKRAFELARLLRARLAFAAHRDDLINPAATAAVLRDEEFIFAMNTALTAAKSERVGTNILEITTCGAISPYNHLLGGKLVALLLLSPEVADDYAQRYGNRPAIISSQLKNAERTKDCTLAWLNTTSLYSLGSSQYERLRLPAGTISSEQGEIRFDHIGDTEGYGTVQFSDATVQAVQAALEELRQFKSVNSIFGEGFSPKFRKLRDGMESLGFNATVLMRHDQQRRMYAVPMWPEADAFLRGEPAKLPDHLRTPGRFRDATARIADFWRLRWLASRLNYAPAIKSLRGCGPWVLSESVEHHPINERSLKSRSRKKLESPEPTTEAFAVVSANQSADDPLQFWRELAQAGPEACADELQPEELDRLHVPQPLDDFLVQQVRRKFSIVLTGNAGDGKTHVLRRLERELGKLGADVETDATAAMKRDDVSPILRRWKKAHGAGRPFCLAANEYPLYLLRLDGKGFAPLEEANRQCEQRLAYANKPKEDEDAREKVLVVDLSLRNPLTSGFAGLLLDKLIGQPELKVAAETDPDGDLAWNLRHLAHPTVRSRLLELFARLAAAGHRATVRELWIWATRLVVGAGSEDRKPVRSAERWYSSRLFDSDDRFALSALLRRLADPANISHPRWDYRLENGLAAGGWEVETDSLKGLQLDKKSHFVAVKRRFYFEHQAGPEVLTLDGIPGNALLKSLRGKHAPDAGFKESLIESINLAYCPELFRQMTRALYLWIGHRFQEQPSHGYVANQSVSDGDLELLRPRLPARLAGAFDYQADHLLLEYRQRDTKPVRLRVDHPLFIALDRLRQGLPRQLLPDRELNRLDAFLEQLRRADVPKTREFFIHNHDERTSAQVVLSPDWNCYESVKTP
jgi:hypothetical protein